MMREVSAGEKLDQYDLTELIARSGMASIFKAHDRLSGATVAIKLPYLQFESDMVFYRRFQREEEVGRRLDHPNIIKVLAPRRRSRMYIAMEYIDGVSLRAILREQRPLAAERALGFARQICEAMVYMHRNGIIHRDLKPENALITADGTLKLMDFGIALDESARRLTWSGISTTIGTPDYMSPEQVNGRHGDARSDVYALGVMLFEMLTGKLPFEADHPQAILRAKTSEPPRAPSYYVPDFDPALERIILRAIAREPRDRYPTARAMLADLRNPSAAAAPAPASQPPRRFVRPLILALIVAGLSSLIWISSR